MNFTNWSMDLSILLTKVMHVYSSMSLIAAWIASDAFLSVKNNVNMHFKIAIYYLVSLNIFYTTFYKKRDSYKC